MKTQALLFIQLALALAIMYSCFCRLTKTDADTHREVRWSFLFQFTCAGILFGAPFLPALMPHEMQWKAGTTPTWAWVMLMLSGWLVQVVTARYWADGVPESFQRRSGTAGVFGGWLAPLVMLLVAVFVAGPNIAVAQAQKDRSPARETVTVPIFTMKAGDTVRCVQADGCIIFTKQALAEEFARYADQACGPSPKPNSPLPRLTVPRT
jgi:hypothetical protein